MAIVDREGKGGFFASTKTAARECGVSRRQAAELFGMLEDSGFLRHAGWNDKLGTVVYRTELDGDCSKKCDRFKAQRAKASASNIARKNERKHRKEQDRKGDTNAAAAHPTNAAAAHPPMQPRADTLCSGRHDTNAAAAHKAKDLSQDLSNGGRRNASFAKVEILPPNMHASMNDLANFAREESLRTRLPADLILRQTKAGTYRRPPESFAERTKRESDRAIDELDAWARAVIEEDEARKARRG